MGPPPDLVTGYRGEVQSEERPYGNRCIRQLGDNRE